MIPAGSKNTASTNHTSSLQAARMRALGEDGVTTSDQRDHLIEMGYIEEEGEEDEKPEDEDKTP